MLPDDAPKFRAVISAMLRVYGQAADPVLMDGYWLALSDWPLAEFEKAAKHLMATAEFMPRPAAFNALRKAGQPTPGEAFAKARQILRDLRPREFIGHNSGDPQLDAAMRACGGYEALAMCTSENIGFFERRFAEHFESITDADSTRLALPSLTRKAGFHVSGPQRMGSIMASLESTFEREPQVDQ